MSQPISELQISTSVQEEQQLSKEDYKKVPGNLNSGTNGPAVYLWYKRGSNKPITRIQCSFRPEMNGSLSDAGFTCVDKDLNKGTRGDRIYLWYMSGCTDFDFYVMELKVTTKEADEPVLFKSGWERLGCDLNRNADGDPVYLWLKRSEPTYISDIRATVDFSEDTVNFESGFFRVDEDTNRYTRCGAGSAPFLWYQHAKASDTVINQIDVSRSEKEEKMLQSEGFTKVNVNLTDGTCRAPVYMWYKRGQASKIQFFTVLVGGKAYTTYKNAGCKIVEKNLHTECGCVPLYIAYN